MGAGAVRVDCIEHLICGHHIPMLLVPLPGPLQTVNSRGLWIVVKLMQSIERDKVLDCEALVTVICSDSSYVVNRHEKGEDICNSGANWDLWQCFWLEWRRLAGRIKLVKVAAHKELEDVVLRRIDILDYYGNAMADHTAEKATSKAALPKEVVDDVRARRLLARRIRERLICTHLVAAKLDPTSARDKLENPTFLNKLGNAEAASRFGQHSLVKAHGGMRCRKCLVVKSLKRMAYWSKVECVRGLVAVGRSDAVDGDAARQDVGVGLSLLQLASDGCVRLGSVRVHVTHRLGFYRGLLWCWKCAGYSAGRHVRKLCSTCPGACGQTGAAQLQRLRVGKLPRSGMCWPMHEDESPPECMLPFLHTVVLSGDQAASIARSSAAAKGVRRPLGGRRHGQAVRGQLAVRVKTACRW